MRDHSSEGVALQVCQSTGLGLWPQPVNMQHCCSEDVALMYKENVMQSHMSSDLLLACAVGEAHL